MDASEKSIAIACMTTVLMNEPWQDLGFKRRPKYGSIIQRMRPSWKVNLEKKVLQEMMAVLSAAHVLAEGESPDLPKKLSEIYIATPELSDAFGFSLSGEGASQLEQAIQQYVAIAPRTWAVTLFQKIDPLELPDKKLRAALTMGCVRFCSTIGTMISKLRAEPAATSA